MLPMLGGVCVTVLEIVKTGTNGRGEVVVVTAVVMGLKNRLGLVVVGLVVSFNGREVVGAVAARSELERGQHTPGTNKLLKQRDSRRCVKSSNSDGQLLRSSHFPILPSGVLQRFSFSFP